MNIFDLLNNNNKDSLSIEEAEYAKRFDDLLREKVIDELVEFECNKLIEDMVNNKELFINKIEQIFINGKKGYKDMPTKTLIDIYIDKKNEGDFIYLIESIGNF